MDIRPGEITQQAYDAQVQMNNAIERDLINLATVKPCSCFGYAPADVYASSMNK